MISNDTDQRIVSSRLYKLIIAGRNLTRIDYLWCSLLLIMIAGVSCTEAKNRPQSSLVVPNIVMGRGADMKTQAKRYDGYEVITQCRAPEQVGVKGLGARSIVDNSSQTITDDERSKAYQDFRDTKLLPGLSAISSVHATGIGAGCTEMGMIVYLSDWREVDAAIAAVGDLIARENLKDEITISVVAPPEVLRATPEE